MLTTKITKLAKATKSFLWVLVFFETFVPFVVKTPRSPEA